LRGQFNGRHCSISLAITQSGSIENNTIITNGTAMFLQQGSNPSIINNIIANATSGIACIYSSSPYIECNNLFNVLHPYGGECTDQTGTNGNISIDPEFCGITGSGNYYLRSGSPCAPGNHPDGYDCGLIGAFEVKCDVPTKKTSWGALKSLFSDSADVDHR
jgi:hypothetical protein